MRVLLIALLMAFGIWLPLMAVPPIEDVIAGQLGISNTLSALLYSAPVAMLALVAIPGGFLADSIGIKRAVGIGAVLLTVGAGLRAIASDFPTVLGFTLLYGLGMGLCFPNLPKLARHCSARERSGVTLGLFLVAVIFSGAISLAITRPAIYPITNTFQGVFLFTSIPVIAATLLWWIFISDPPCETAGVETVKFDLASMRRMMRRRDLWLASTLFLLHNFVLYTFVGWTPGYFKSIGASGDTAALIASVVLWTGMPAVFFLTRLSSRLGRKKPFIWGPSLFLIAGCYIMLIINIPASPVLMVFVGIATSIRFATVLALPVEMVGPEQSGSASGMAMSIGYTGAIIGPLVGGFVLDRTGSYEWVFLSLVIVSAVTAVVAFIVPETGSHGRH